MLIPFASKLCVDSTQFWYVLPFSRVFSCLGLWTSVMGSPCLWDQGQWRPFPEESLPLGILIFSTQGYYVRQILGLCHLTQMWVALDICCINISPTPLIFPRCTFHMGHHSGPVILYNHSKIEYVRMVGESKCLALGSQQYWTIQQLWRAHNILACAPNGSADISFS